MMLVNFFLFGKGSLWVCAKNAHTEFDDGEFSLDVNVSPSEDTVWLTQKQITELFEKSISTINEHINNALNEELKELKVSRKFGKTELSSIVTKPITFYNLDVIIYVGYRVKSNRGVLFRKWALETINNIKAKKAMLRH